MLKKMLWVMLSKSCFAIMSKEHPKNVNIKLYSFSTLLDNIFYDEITKWEC